MLPRSPLTLIFCLFRCDLRFNFDWRPDGEVGEGDLNSLCIKGSLDGNKEVGLQQCEIGSLSPYTEKQVDGGLAVPAYHEKRLGILESEFFFPCYPKQDIACLFDIIVVADPDREGHTPEGVLGDRGDLTLDEGFIGDSEMKAIEGPDLDAEKVHRLNRTDVGADFYHIPDHERLLG